MPNEHHTDPRLLEAVTAELFRASTAALEASDEILAHYGDTGDVRAQQAVDTLVDRAAGSLRALGDSLAETCAELQRTSTERTPLRAATVRLTAADESRARPRAMPEHRE